MPRGSAAELGAQIITAAQLGRLLGISERRVRELRDNGVIPDNGLGQYELGRAIAAYCAHIRPATGRGAAGGSDAAQTLDEARVRLLTAQAEHREMLNEQMRGEAVLAEDMEAVVGAMIDAARAKLLALPTRAAPRLMGVRSNAEIRDLLTTLVHEALGGLQQETVCLSVLDRTRERVGMELSEERPQ